MFKFTALLCVLIGLATCFCGYRLQKYFVALQTGFLFAILGILVGASSSDSPAAAILLGIIFFIVGAIMGYKLFRVFIIITCTLSAFVVSYFIIAVASMELDTISTAGLIGGVLIAAVTAFLTAKLLKPYLIITTSLVGAVLCVNNFDAMIHYGGYTDYIATKLGTLVGSAFPGLLRSYGYSSPDSGSTGITIFILLFTALGIFVQWKTTEHKPKSFATSLPGGGSYAAPVFPRTVPTPSGMAAPGRVSTPGTPAAHGVATVASSVAAKAPARADMNFCSQCGASLEEGASFCTDCGAKIG